MLQLDFQGRRRPEGYRGRGSTKKRSAMAKAPELMSLQLHETSILNRLDRIMDRQQD